MTLKNRRGVIASTYDELQALPHLRAARDAYALPKASGAGGVRALLQAAEIALLNVADLLARARADVEGGALGRAVVKLSWAHGFHRVLLRLSMATERLVEPAAEVVHALHIDDSPAFRAFVDALAAFDQGVAAAGLPIEEALAHESLDTTLFRLLHLARVSNHEATVWEPAFAAVPVGADAPPYEQYVATAELRAAVDDTKLDGDTFFMQFRGLHQIPEIVADEVNDRLEAAIRALRGDELRASFDHLAAANLFLDVMVACVPPMADNLATADYHDIRENLGLTSGAHSAALRYHLFHDLYEQLCAALLAALGTSDGDLAQSVQRVAEMGGETRGESDRAWLLDLLLREALTLRRLIDRWRMLHMHLPRNNVGGFATKSLAGSRDAVEAVRQMRDSAAGSDPLRSLRLPHADDSRAGKSALQAYLQSPASLDRQLLTATGRITQDRFPDVQRRTGIYAGDSPFVPPPERKVE